MQGSNDQKVRRRFVRVGDRGVHYLRAGEGPPVVLLHEAGSSAFGVLPLLDALADDHTVFALDHPGYGESDPLSGETVDVADGADALSETLAALDLPACPVYGLHTGASSALELGRRHPTQVSALVLDGPCMFRPSETAYFLTESYMRPFTVRDDGAHLLATWVKARDRITWFPWNQRKGANRWTYPFPDAEDLHQMFLDQLRAGDGYRQLYRAAFVDGRRAAAELTVPATFMARATDELLTHLDRLPNLKDNQEIVRLPPDADPVREQAAILRKYRVEENAPEDAGLRPTRGAINRRYIDLGEIQILARSAGEELDRRPLLLLHDGRGSSQMLQPLMTAFARHRPVYALDLPDNGASDALSVQQPEIVDYVNCVAAAWKGLELGLPDIYAVGAGSAVAIELVSQPEFSRAHVVMEAPDFYSPSFAQRLAAAWAPPIEPTWDGAHLNAVWLMLRDEYAFWPWFDKTAEAASAVDAPEDWRELHGRVVDILRSLGTYHRLTMAALRYDWSSALAGAEKSRIALGVTATDPRRPHVEAVAKDAGLTDPVILPLRVGDKAVEILRLIDG